MLIAANGLELQVLDLETEQRGSILTRQMEFLVPWQQAVATLPQEGLALLKLVTGDSAQEARVREIVTAARSYIDDYSVPLVNAAARDDPSARTIAATAEGEARVDAIRADFAQLFDAERRTSTATARASTEAAQDVEDPDVESAKRHEVQPADFVGYFSTAYTGILTWQHWVSYLYPPTQTELLSLKPDEYTHYEVLQAQGTARSLSAASNFLDAHASPQSVQFAAVAADADATASPDRATELYKQAAAIRQGTYEFIPYAYGALVYAIRPGIKGVHLWTGYFTISFKGVSVG